MENDSPEIEPKEEIPRKGQISSKSKTSKGAGLDGLRRDLCEKELNDSGARKMLLNLFDMVSAENSELKDQLVGYHRIDKELAIYKTKLASLNTNITLKSIFSSLGFLLLGFVPYLYDKKWYGLLVCLCIVSVLLIVVPYAIVI